MGIFDNRRFKEISTAQQSQKDELAEYLGTFKKEDAEFDRDAVHERKSNIKDAPWTKPAPKPDVRPVRMNYKHKCGVTSSFATAAAAKMIADDPKVFGSLYCNKCKHSPTAEFVWEDGTKVGS